MRDKCPPLNRRFKSIWPICAACLGMLAPLAQAQLQIATDPTIVTVTDQAVPVSATSASTTIISRDYIESRHADNAADLLRATPFLQLAQNGASGGLATGTIRGGTPNFTLVMIDGIPVNLDVSTELGRFLRRQFGIDTAGTWKALRCSASGSWLNVGQQVKDDAYSVGGLALNGSVDLGRNRVLDFTARWLDDQSAGFPTGGGGPELAIVHQPQSDYALELVLGASFKGQVRP